MQASFFPPQCLPGLCSQTFSVNHTEILTLAAHMLLCFALLSSLVEKSVYCAEKHSQGVELKSDFTSLENRSAAHVMDCSWTINHGLGISDAISLVWARSLPYETVLKFQGHRTSVENDDPFPYRGTGPIMEI